MTDEQPLVDAAKNAGLQQAAAPQPTLTCGKCQHAHFHPKAELTQRVCWGAPATPVQVIGANGQPQWVNMRGTVGIGDQACGAFKPKPGLGHQCPTCLTWHMLDG